MRTISAAGCGWRSTRRSRGAKPTRPRQYRVRIRMRVGYVKLAKVKLCIKEEPIQGVATSLTVIHDMSTFGSPQCSHVIPLLVFDNIAVATATTPTPRDVHVDSLCAQELGQPGEPRRTLDPPRVALPFMKMRHSSDSVKCEVDWSNIF